MGPRVGPCGPQRQEESAGKVASAQPAPEKEMSVLNEIESAGKKIGDVLTDVVNFGRKIRIVYGALSAPTLAAASAVFYDTVKAISAAQAAAAAAEGGAIPATITLSETTLGLVRQVVTDAKAGETEIVADFKALNLKF